MTAYRRLRAVLLPGQARSRPGRPVRGAITRALALVLATAALGFAVGFVVGVLTPAHTEVAGSDTRILLKLGRSYDQVSVAGLLSGKKATGRSLLGEQVGVRVQLDIDPSLITNANGEFDTNILPAYVQAFSDPQQLVTDIRIALLEHLLTCAGAGAAIALLLVTVWRGYRIWRAGYDAGHWPGGRAAATVHAYRTPERRLARRLSVALVALLALGSVPASVPAPRNSHQVRPDPVLTGTPLEGIEVDGLLRPALVAVENYIETYFKDTDSYYDQLRTALDQKLAADPVTLPDGPAGADVTNIGFVTDRHCNIGMDRVIVDLLRHFHIDTLVSGGDDAFSGSFSFESACTRNLADKTEQAGITDVFVGGNHDSPQTIEKEKKQGIKTLTGSVQLVHGLSFLGSPDPRTSRYGQGIVPSSTAAQDKLMNALGTATGRTACAEDGPVIVVLHGPDAGTTALQQGCGKARLALDGHTHVQSGPNAVTLADGSSGYQLTGGTAGGAPSDQSIEKDFASRLTVGPLHNPAVINILTVDRRTGTLVGVTEFTFAPSTRISVSQQVVSG